VGELRVGVEGLVGFEEEGELLGFEGGDVCGWSLGVEGGGEGEESCDVLEHRASWGFGDGVRISNRKAVAWMGDGGRLVANLRDVPVIVVA